MFQASRGTTVEPFNLGIKDSLLRSIAEALQARDLTVESPCFLTGFSAAKHGFDLKVSNESGAQVFADLHSSRPNVDKVAVLELFVKVLDLGLERAILIADPVLSTKGRQFAELYGIELYETADSPQVTVIAHLVKSSLDNSSISIRAPQPPTQT